MWYVYFKIKGSERLHFWNSEDVKLSGSSSLREESSTSSYLLTILLPGEDMSDHFSSQDRYGKFYIGSSNNCVIKEDTFNI